MTRNGALVVCRDRCDRKNPRAAQSLAASAQKKAGLPCGSPAQGTSLFRWRVGLRYREKESRSQCSTVRPTSRLAAEADLTETKLGALESGSSGSRRSRFRSGSLGGGRSRFATTITTAAAATIAAAATAAAIAAVATIATTVATVEQATVATRATMAVRTSAAVRTAVATMSEQTVTTVAAATVASTAVATTVTCTTVAAVATIATMTSDRLAVGAQQGHADHREKDRDAESQCTIHANFLHKHTGSERDVLKQRLPSNASFSAHPAGRPPGQAKRLRQTCRPLATPNPDRPPCL